MSDIILITGGCRSGKSAFAVELARRLRQPTLFLATCVPGDDAEMRARVAAHRRERPPEWRVHEEAFDLASALPAVAETVAVLDCLPTWIGNLLVRGDSEAAVASAVTAALAAARACPARWLIAITAEVGAGLVPETPLGRRFRDQVGHANQRWAAAADRVYALVAGLPIELKARAQTAAAVAAGLEKELPA